MQSGWELDDSEAAELHTSRENAFNYMVNMVRENNLPGDYSLNEESVQAFVSWKNNTNLVRKIAWPETNQSVYSQFGPYWPGRWPDVIMIPVNMKSAWNP